MHSHYRKAPDLDKFRKLLKDKSLKETPQRLAVHGAMMVLVHASADMVAEYLALNSDVGISLPSVYNVLTGLADAGIYARRMSSNNKMYFDVNTGRHVHLYDKRNNVYRDLEDDGLLSLVEAHFKGRRFKGYKLEGVDIQLICRPSRNRKKE